MKQIKGRDNEYLSGCQQMHDVRQYKLTDFCITKKTNDGVLLYHTMTGELLLLTPSEYEALKNNDLSNKDWAKQWKECCFLIPESTNEYALINEIRTGYHHQEDAAITAYTVFPTTRCNAQCFYCYEKETPKQTMTRETAKAVVSYIIEHCQKQKVSLSWFGGEPTVSSDVITFICTELRKRHIAFESGIISNGYLFDKELCDTAKKCWNLKNIQITVDGTETVYNETKNYKFTTGSPYKTVLSNIHTLLDMGIRVSVRINLGQHNLADVHNLIDELRKQFSNNRFLMIYVRPINNCYDENVNSKLLMQSTDINIMLKETGINGELHLPSLKTHSCMADSKSAILINPSGDLGKCEHYIYNKLCGSIFYDEIDTDVLKFWQERFEFDICHDCPLYPSCYVLRGCEGGRNICSELKKQYKILEIQSSMMILYSKWKHEFDLLTTRKKFVLKNILKIEDFSSQATASFFEKDDRQPVRTIEVNDTAIDILVFLQEAHCFGDIIKMLKDKYDTYKQPLEDIVLNYLRFLFRNNLIIISDALSDK